MADANTLVTGPESVQGGSLVHVHGEIDYSNAPELRHELITIIKDNPGLLIVDLQDVSHMDSSGLATLVEALREIGRKNSRLVLCGMQPRVRSIFEIARLDTVFNIVSDVQEATRS